MANVGIVGGKWKSSNSNGFLLFGKEKNFGFNRFEFAFCKFVNVYNIVSKFCVNCHLRSLVLYTLRNVHHCNKLYQS